ncbi:homoserine O-acetyltransferase MetX [Alicyclobacillus sp. ALC3]|uniref:homoserine O-acetyltransferase MetX n=1 Tax=Alicyclobacillus sp. ALC3 TaxID=2796143 RepID=UPI002379920F|nr:homoserine O-acetyltransferase [Alicyclobacillus sp. ALC3]
MDAHTERVQSVNHSVDVPYRHGVERLEAFRFESGEVLPYVEIAYEAWGTLSPTRDNVVVICHALTGDAHAGPGNPDGWWSGLIGPGKLLDTNTSFVLASNVLGGCAGSTGPSSLAADGQPYALRFPLVTVRDIVRAQVRLTEQLGVERVQLVIGGSLGGMQAWEWPLVAPGRVEHTVVVAAHAAFPPLAIGYNQAMRQAIVNDPDWQQGNYYGTGRVPSAGLNVARAIGMLTYRTDELYLARFGRDGRASAAVAPGEQPDPLWFEVGRERATLSPLAAFTEPQFAVESYLQYQGEKLLRRFDANSYLYLSRAMDSHDIGRGRGGVPQALRHLESQLTVVAIDSDYLYGAQTLKQTAEVARHSGVDCEYLELSSAYGHDAFLLEQSRVAALIAGRLRGHRS